MGTLYGFKHPSQYDKESLFKPASKANTKLILAEEDNIQHILASLALKVTRQSVIIAKLSSCPRKNRTKKALWELDNLRRSLLVAGSEPFLTRLILGLWNPIAHFIPVRSPGFLWQIRPHPSSPGPDR